METIYNPIDVMSEGTSFGYTDQADTGGLFSDSNNAGHAITLEGPGGSLGVTQDVMVFFQKRTEGDSRDLIHG